MIVHGNLMSFLTVDFETYYDDKYKLRHKNTGLTTEEYIRDPRFEVIGVGISVDGAKATWFSGSREQLTTHLQSFDWVNSAVLCHNTLFDGAILKWIFGIAPAFYYDTLSMARALHGIEVGGSLASLALKYRLGVKGDDAQHAKGKRRSDFSEADLKAYGEYCCNDTDLTFKLFQVLATGFPESEHQLIDMTLRMFIDPVFEIDSDLLTRRLEELREERSILLSGLMHVLQVGSEEEVRKKLSSNKQFAKILSAMGVIPPTKISSRTNKVTLALAKTDEGFLELQNHPDPEVQQLCAVRLDTKSTIEDTRMTQFIDIGSRNSGLLPIPLKYYAAHTGRWGGMEDTNLQNLPSRDKKKATLKNALRAPSGFKVLNGDSSQIEARLLVWLAGQIDVVQAFAEGRDVYCEDATKVYGRQITKADVMERFVGKTMRLGLGFGSGAKKLQWMLKIQPPCVELPLEECQRLVSVWRRENYRVTDLWNDCDRALKDLMAWPVGKNPYTLCTLFNSSCVKITSDGVLLPNTLLIRYGNLRVEDNNFVYDSRKGPVKIWGAAMVENIIQALARIVVSEQMIKINARYRVVLTVHDSIVVVVPDSEIEEATKFVTEIMSMAPTWAPGLPLACEVKSGNSYGEIQ